METLGRYTLLRRVAAGGMAEIWKAKAVGPAGFQKTVAIKRILPHLVEETEFIQMFIEEAKLAAELVHPNIIQVFDFGQLGQNDYFIAMEYVAGPSLARLLKRIGDRQGSFPPAAALYVIAEAAKGLGHAHAKADETGRPLGIVHRDVSPQNILISYSGEVKIGDFGIAKAAGAVTRTLEGQVRGKLSYMSPEQANAKKTLDGRSDLFSLGIVLYELLTGRRLFPTNLTTAEAYGRVAGYRGLDLEDLAAVPGPFREIVGKALQAEPEQRYASGAELDFACTRLLGTAGIARAKEQLATMVQTLFDEERKFELTPTGAPTIAPAAAMASPGAVIGSLGGERAESETVKSPVAPIPTSGTPLQPRPTNTGLTLASSKMQVGPAPPTPDAGAPTPRRTSPAMILALAGGLVALVLATGLAARLAGFGAPAPDPVATATPDMAGVAGAATTEETAPPIAKTSPTPATNVARVSPTPERVTVTPTPERVARPGVLSVTSRPWVQVWVDGRMVKQETPLPAYKLSAGRHRVRFVNPGLGFDETRVVNVPSNGEVSVYIDVRAGSIRIK